VSGPWEDYQSAAPPAPAAPAAPAVASAPPVVADEPEGPWSDFAAPEAAPPLTTPLSSEQIGERLNTMMSEAAPAADIAAFIAEHGRPMNEADMKWLNEDYEQSRLKGFPQRRLFTVAPQTEEREQTGAGEALWRGLQSGALRGFDDELVGFVGAAGNKLGTALGLNESNADFWDIYETLRQEQQSEKDQAWEDRPGMFSAGFLPGSITGPSWAGLGGGGGSVRQAANTAGAEGFISAMGNSEGDLIDRLPNATAGGFGGYALGGVLKPVVDVGAGILNRTKERLGFGPAANTADSGLEALARRANPDVPAMESRLAELQDLGFDDVRLLDLLDESGRGVVSAAANKGTPANTDLARFADDVYSSAQDRVAGQAERVISGNPMTAGQIADATTGLRDDTIERAMEPIRSQPVPITDEVLDILGTREGVAALRGAQGFMTDPADKAGVDNILAAVRTIQKIDPAFPEAIRKQIAREVMKGANLTVDVADKFARAMKGRGSKNPGLERVATKFANAVRDAARSQSDDYAAALDNYADASGVIDAAQGTGRRFENTDFLRARPDELASAVDNAAPTGPTFIDDVGEARTGMSEQEAMRVRARDEVANRAREGSGAQAMSTARQIARGSNQRRRNEALLGPEKADSLQRGMAAEVNRVDATRYVDPRIGSQTYRRMQEAENSGVEDTVVETAASAGFSPVWTIVRAAGRFLKNTGMRGVDAERLVRDAIDPARTQDALAYLVQRGMPKSEAQQLLRTIQVSARDGRLQGRLAGEGAGDDRPTAPGSVRSLNTRRRINN
jgi:hypothetical protein